MKDETKSQSKNNTPTKTQANRNVMVHGLYASEIILPWESKKEFEQLHQDLKEEWSPCGRMELETVFGLARLFWIKRRLMRTWELGFRKDRLVQSIVNSGKKDLYSKMQEILVRLSEELPNRRQNGDEKIVKLHQEWGVCMSQIQKFFLLPAKTEHPQNRTQTLDQA